MYESIQRTNEIQEGCCPFLETHDLRCSSRFTLSQLDGMLEMCVGGGASRCVMYHRLRMEQEQGTLVAKSPLPMPDPVLMTCNGATLGL